MEEGLEISQKKKLFFIYKLPITFFIMFILLAIIQLILAIGACSIFPHGIELKLAGITMAVCQETIPILVAPLPILILLGISITIWKLIKYYKNIESIQLSKSTYWLKLIGGGLFWLIFAFQLFYIFIILLDLTG